MTFVPYQVDYTVKNTAKTMGFSKKRVSFRFGLANPVALAEGLTGAQCRGSEHEVVFLWSLKSGKRHLLLDGKDVHFSESGMNGWTVDRAWQFSFPLRDASGTFKVHFISQPVNREIPNSRPFDLCLNGVSYFTFNEIWKLGTPGMTVRDSPRRHHHSRGRDSPMSPEERRQVAAAKVESLREYREQQERNKSQEELFHSQGKGMQREEQSLISFDNDPAPPDQVLQQTNSGGMMSSSITLDSAIDDTKQFNYGQPPLPPSNYGAPGPYGQAMPNYGQPTTYGQPSPTASQSTALTPYGGQPTAAPQTYVDAAGRVALGQPQPVYGGGYGNPAPGAAAGVGGAGLMSPSAQSYASYGSAPSFAQPPPPQPTMPEQPPSAAASYASYSTQPTVPPPGGAYPPPPPPQQAGYPPTYPAY